MADNRTAFSNASIAAAARATHVNGITAASLHYVNGTVVTDTILGGMLIAGRTCQQPDALTVSGSQASVIQG